MTRSLAVFHTLQKLHGRERDRLVNELVKQNYGLVHREADRQYQVSRLEYADIEQAGAIGLTKAVQSFDPSLGFEFSSYAIPRIRGEIMHLIRDDCPGGIKVDRTFREHYSRWQSQWRKHPSFSLEQIAVADLTYRNMSRDRALEYAREVISSCSRKTLSDVDEIQVESDVPDSRIYEIQRVLAKLPHPLGFVLRNSVEMPLDAIARYLNVSTDQVGVWLAQAKQLMMQFEGELV